MNSMTIVIFILFMLSNIMIILSMILSKKSTYEREKNSPFECGFNPLSSSRLPFSLKFFMLTIIFLIFDVEIILFIPIILSLNKTILLSWNVTTLLFLMILILGLIHEWNQMTLDWLKK